MQVLWSRASPTRTACRCRACFSRSTTAVSKRRLKIGDLFTACYSTILGTAVFADAKVKEDRRKEWDRVIEEAKAGIVADAPNGRSGTEQSHGESPTPATSTVLGDTNKWKSTTFDGMSMTSSSAKHQVNISLDSYIKQTIPQLASRQETFSLEVDEFRPTESDDIANLSEPTDNTFRPRGPVTPYHLLKMEEMVSNLVTSLLQKRSDPPGEIHKVSHNDVREILDQLQSLRADVRLPSFTNAADIWPLNRSIGKLLKNIAADQTNLDLILVKICYNLLVSASPPNIQTYNTLIRSFNRLKMYQLSQVVVESFLHESKFKPTSETIKLLLDHYSRQKDKAGFRAIIDRMRAVKGDLRIQMRAVDDIDQEFIQEWAITKKVVRRYAHLREKVTRDSVIFDSLVNGFLELDMLREAVRYIRAALREGMQISSDTLLRLVQACTGALDYKSGLSILRQLLSHYEHNSEQIVYTGPARLAVHQLLALCGIRSFSSEAELLPLRVSHKVVRSLKRHMTIQSMEDAIDHYAVRIMRLDALLGRSTGATVQSPTWPTDRNIQEALKILYALSHHEQLRSGKKKANNRHAATLRHAQTGHLQWLTAQYDKLQKDWRAKYDSVLERVPDLSWSDRLEILSHFRQGRDLLPGHHLYAATVKSNKKSQELRRSRYFPPQDKLQSGKSEKARMPLRLGHADRDLLPQKPALPLPPSMPRTTSTLNLSIAQVQHHATMEAFAG